MKFLDGVLVLSIIILSLSQGESHFVKPWHFCKSKEVTDPPTPCTPLECSGLCGSLYIGGVGICIAEACQCLHSCIPEGPVPPSRSSSRNSKLRDTKPEDGNTPKMVWSSPAASKDHLKPDHSSKMTFSSSHEDHHLKPERISKVAALSSSVNLKHQSSSSKDQLKPDRISKVALTSPIPINKPDRISITAQAVQP